MIEFHGVYLDPRTLCGVYEQDEIDMAARLFQPTDRILLAGCGSGLLAATIAATVKPSLLVCLEPNRSLSQLVRENVRVNGEPLYIIDGAVGSDPGTTRLGGGDCWATNRTGVDVGEEVPVIALNDLIYAYGLNALCLDIEGAEYDLLAAVPPEITAALVELHRPPEFIPFDFPTTTTLIRSGVALQWGRR